MEYVPVLRVDLRVSVRRHRIADGALLIVGC